MQRLSQWPIIAGPPAACVAEDAMSTRLIPLGALLLLATATMAGCGVVAADGEGQETAVVSEQTAVAISERDLQPVETFDTAAEAVIAAAAAVHPGATDLRVSNTVVILASEQIVDLRVQVVGDDVCDWYGVSSIAGANGIAWHAGLSLIGCEPAQ